MSVIEITIPKGLIEPISVSGLLAGRSQPENPNIDFGLVSRYQDLAARHLYPTSLERSKRTKFPIAFINTLVDHNLAGLAVPEEYGGLGFSPTTPTYARVLAAVAESDAPAANAWHMSNVGADVVRRAGTQDQIVEILSQIKNGLLLATATSPVDGWYGGAVMDEGLTPATQGGEKGWWLRRTLKPFVSLAKSADLFMLTSFIEGAEGQNATDLALTVLLPRDAVKSIKPVDLMGNRTSETCSVEFEGFVPESSVVGEKKGAVLASGAFSGFPFGYTATQWGTAERVFRGWVKGQDLSDPEIIQKIGLYSMQRATAQLLLDQASSAFKSGDVQAGIFYITTAKHFADSLAVSMAHEALESGGGGSKLRSSERFYNYANATTTRAMPPSTQTALETVGDIVLGKEVRSILKMKKSPKLSPTA